MRARAQDATPYACDERTPAREANPFRPESNSAADRGADTCAVRSTRRLQRSVECGSVAEVGSRRSRRARTSDITFVRPSQRPFVHVVHGLVESCTAGDPWARVRGDPVVSCRAHLVTVSGYYIKRLIPRHSRGCCEISACGRHQDVIVGPSDCHCRRTANSPTLRRWTAYASALLPSRSAPAVSLHWSQRQPATQRASDRLSGSRSRTAWR